MSTFTINGIAFSGSSISINKGKVTIDGIDRTPGDEKNISIQVNGNIDSLDCDHAHRIEVTGYVASVKTMSGDVKINGDLNGNANTMSGDISANSISGKCSTMSGDINKN